MITQLDVTITVVVGSVLAPFALRQTDPTFHVIEFPTPPRSVWSFVYRTLHKWCMVIDKARQLGTILIIKAAHITERLGDDITFTDICYEAGVVNRSISTYVIVFQDRRGFVVTGNSKAIGAKMSTDIYVTSDEEEAVMARSSTFPRLCVTSVTFCFRSASDIK